MIRINDEYAIDADIHCYTLCQKGIVATGKNAGEQFWKTLGYYPTVSGCLQGLQKHLQRQAVQTEDMTLNEAYEAFRKLYEQVREWAEKYDGDPV